MSAHQIWSEAVKASIENAGGVVNQSSSKTQQNNLGDFLPTSSQSPGRSPQPSPDSQQKDLPHPQQCTGYSSNQQQDQHISQSNVFTQNIPQSYNQKPCSDKANSIETEFWQQHQHQTPTAHQMSIKTLPTRYSEQHNNSNYVHSKDFPQRNPNVNNYQIDKNISPGSQPFLNSQTELANNQSFDHHQAHLSTPKQPSQQRPSLNMASSQHQQSVRMASPSRPPNMQQVRQIFPSQQFPGYKQQQQVQHRMPQQPRQPPSSSSVPSHAYPQTRMAMSNFSNPLMRPCNRPSLSSNPQADLSGQVQASQPSNQNQQVQMSATAQTLQPTAQKRREGCPKNNDRMPQQHGQPQEFSGPHQQKVPHQNQNAESHVRMPHGPGMRQLGFDDSEMYYDDEEGDEEMDEEQMEHSGFPQGYGYSYPSSDSDEDSALLEELRFCEDKVRYDKILCRLREKGIDAEEIDEILCHNNLPQAGFSAGAYKEDDDGDEGRVSSSSSSQSAMLCNRNQMKPHTPVFPSDEQSPSGICQTPPIPHSQNEMSTSSRLQSQQIVSTMLSDDFNHHVAPHGSTTEGYHEQGRLSVQQGISNQPQQQFSDSFSPAASAQGDSLHPQQQRLELKFLGHGNQQKGFHSGTPETGQPTTQASNCQPLQNAQQQQQFRPPGDPRQPAPKTTSVPTTSPGLQIQRSGVLNRQPQPHPHIQNQPATSARPHGPTPQGNVPGVVVRPVQHLIIRTINQAGSPGHPGLNHSFIARQTSPSQSPLAMGSVSANQDCGSTGATQAPTSTTMSQSPQILQHTQQRTEEGIPGTVSQGPPTSQDTGKPVPPTTQASQQHQGMYHSPNLKAALCKDTASSEASLARLKVMYMQQSLDQEIMAKKGGQSVQLPPGQQNPGNLPHQQYPGNLQHPSSMQNPGNLQHPGNIQNSCSIQNAGNLQNPGNQQNPGNLQNPGSIHPGNLQNPGSIHPGNLQNSGNQQHLGNQQHVGLQSRFSASQSVKQLLHGAAGQLFQQRPQSQTFPAYQPKHQLPPRQPIPAIQNPNPITSQAFVGDRPICSVVPFTSQNYRQAVPTNVQQRQIAPQQNANLIRSYGSSTSLPQQIGNGVQHSPSTVQKRLISPAVSPGGPLSSPPNSNMAASGMFLQRSPQQVVSIHTFPQLSLPDQPQVLQQQHQPQALLQQQPQVLQQQQPPVVHQQQPQVLQQPHQPQVLQQQHQPQMLHQQHQAQVLQQQQPHVLQQQHQAQVLQQQHQPQMLQQQYQPQVLQQQHKPQMLQQQHQPQVLQQQPQVLQQQHQPQITDCKMEALSLDHLSADKLVITTRGKQQGLVVNMLYQIRSSDNSLVLAKWNGEHFEDLKPSDVKVLGQIGQVPQAGLQAGQKPASDFPTLQVVQNVQSSTSDTDKKEVAPAASCASGMPSKFQAEFLQSLTQNKIDDENEQSSGTELHHSPGSNANNNLGQNSDANLQKMSTDAPSDDSTYVKPLQQGQPQPKNEPVEEDNDDSVFKKPFSENEDYFRVCQYCGYTSKNFKRCEGCSRVFHGEVKIHCLKKIPAKASVLPSSPTAKTANPKPVTKEAVKRKSPPDGQALSNVTNCGVPNAASRGRGRASRGRSGRTKGGGLKGRMGARGTPDDNFGSSSSDDSSLDSKTNSDGSGSSTGASGRRRPARPKSKNPTPRKRTKKTDEPVTVTISSDEDEPTSTSNNTSAMVPSPASSTGSESSIFPSTPANPVNAFGRFRRVLMEDEEGNSKLSKKIQQQSMTPHTNRHEENEDDDEEDDEDGEEAPTYEIDIRSVRIGSMRTQPEGPLLINMQGVCLKLKSERTDEAFECEILAQQVEQVKYFSGQTQPVLFLFLTPEGGAHLRSICHMKPGGDEYFDPASTDMKQKMVVIIIECFNFITHDMLRETLSLWADLNHVEDDHFTEELTEESANDLLIQSAPPVLTVDIERDVVKFKRRYLRETKSMSVVPRISNSPSDSTDNEPDSTSSSPPENKFFFGSSVRLLQYPPPPARGLAITTEDLFCLTEGEFLNDVIIDFYLQYLYEEKLSEEDKKRTHVFSSFFYKRLTQRDRHSDKTEEDAKKSLPERRHARVKKWTKTVDLFSKDFIIVPINEHSHWYLAVICFPGLATSEVVPFIPSNSHRGDNDEESNDNTADERGNEENGNQDSLSKAILGRQLDAKTCLDNEVSKYNIGQKQPCILMFDSLAGPSRIPNVRMLRDYVQCEWNAKKSEPRQVSKILRSSTPKVPQQSNYSDCGVFLLQYVQSFFEDPIADFQIPMKGLQNWFPEELVHNKRREIHELIMNLHRKYQEDRGDPQVLDIKFESMPRESLMKFHPNMEMMNFKSEEAFRAGSSRDDDSSNSSTSRDMTRLEQPSLTSLGIEDSSSVKAQHPLGNQQQQNSEEQRESKEQDTNDSADGKQGGC